MKLLNELSRRNRQKFVGFYIFFISCAVIISVAGVLVARTTGDMSQAAVAMDVAVLTRFLIFISIVTAVNAVVSAASAFFLTRFSGNVGYRFRDTFTRHFLHLPFQEFEKKNSGRMLSVFSNDVSLASNFMTSDVLGIFKTVAIVVASFIFMLSISPVYTLIFFALYPVLIIMQAILSNPLQKITTERLLCSEECTSIVNDSLQNIPIVAAYSLEDFVEDRYIAAYSNYFEVLKRFVKYLSMIMLFGLVTSSVPLMFIIVATGTSVINNGMSFAEFIAFTTLALSSFGILMNLAQEISSLSEGTAAAKRYNEILGDGSTENVTKDNDSVILNKGEIVRFENVCFTYDGENLVLDNVSFEINEGEKVAFVGASGSGKSTVLKLMLGLYKPLSGRVIVSGHVTANTATDMITAHFAYVPQDSFLFPASIGENITCVNHGEADKERLKNACKDASILDFIDSLPNKYDTILSESAENISGGQKQRLSIARAFYKDAPILLFDEATSALDPATEEVILKTIKKRPAGRTVLMVAHRVNVISSCDRVIILNAGKLVDIGSYEQVKINILNNESLNDDFTETMSVQIKEGV